MVASLSTRYRGLRPLLSKWEGRGFNRDLKNLHRLLDSGSAQVAEMEVMEFSCQNVLLESFVYPHKQNLNGSKSPNGWLVCVVTFSEQTTSVVLRVTMRLQTKYQHQV